jgi:hypothetical protein
MGNDKVFGLWVVALIAGITTVITTQVLAGVATVPTLIVFAEHVGLGLLIRGAYKSFDGPYHIFSGATEPATVIETAASTSGGTADALS